MISDVISVFKLYEDWKNAKFDVNIKKNLLRYEVELNLHIIGKINFNSIKVNDFRGIIAIIQNIDTKYLELVMIEGVFEGNNSALNKIKSIFIKSDDKYDDDIGKNKDIPLTIIARKLLIKIKEIQKLTSIGINYPGLTKTNLKTRINHIEGNLENLFKALK